MSKYTVVETTQFFCSYGLKIEEKYIQEWVDLENSKAIASCENHRLCEDDIDDFNDWYRWKGTAHEEGIDDQTKIERLFEEIEYLKTVIEKVNEEKAKLEKEMGILPF
jgi:hypothetical protein